MSAYIVDPVITGDNAISVRPSVRVATTAPGTLTTSFVVGASVDGLVLALGDRLLVKDQASAAENGIYEVQTSGAPLRALDMQTGQVGTGITTFVRTGTTNGGTYWSCTSTPALVGTNSLAFQRMDSFGTLAVARGGTGTTSFGGTNTLLYTPSANTLSSLVTANNAVLVTSGGGVPSLSTVLPSGILLQNPRVTTGLFDAAGLSILDLPSVGSAVNNFSMTNAATTTPPVLAVEGTDANIALRMQAKGTGTFEHRATSTKAAEIRLFEQTTNGTSYVGLTVGNVTTAGGSYSARLPLQDGTSGQFLSTDGLGNWSFTTAVPGGTQRIGYLLSPNAVVANSQNFTDAAFFTWLQSQYSSFTNGMLIYEVVWVNTNLVIQVINATTSTVLAGPTTISSSGFFTLAITLPTANARLSVQVKAAAKGGTAPQVYGPTLQFNAPIF